ncbi:MAG: transcriptional repressor [Clostridia bacterium]|nr:transcriptional repressor [Clostridia bacterium]
MKQQRMTKQKQLVLSVAQAHCDHPTADQIYMEVRAIDGRISRGTVYRNLEQLSETGNLLHVKVPGAGRFDSRLEYHYHMVCKNCNAVHDVPFEYRRELDELLFEKSGFKVERHRTVFEGLCPDCAKKLNP